MQKRVMRLLSTVLATLFLTACASAPRPIEPGPQAPAPVARPTGALIGLTASELITRFGQPQLQVREGPGLKLQWAANGCVLDIYLYPEGAGGSERATHVDTRRPSGDPLSQPECVGLLRR